MICHGSWAKLSPPVRFCRLGRRVRTPVRVSAEGTVESVTPSSLQSAPMEASALEPSALEGSSLDAVKDAAAAQSAQAGELLADLRDSVTKAANEAVESVKSLSGDATDSASEVLKKVNAVVSSNLGDLSQQTQSTLDSIKLQIDALEHDASEEIQSALKSLEESIAILKSQAIEAVPPEVKESIEIARPYVRSASDFVVANQTPLLVLSTFLFGYAGFAFYNYRFVGYSGDMYPEKVLKLLQSDAPALLVDIRSEDIQKRDGIPKLRRKALGKAISIPFIQLDSSLKRQLNVNQELTSDVTAAYIAGHRQATQFTNFVILSRDGEQGRSIARSLRRLDCPNAFVMLGGIAAWKESDLPISESAVYDVTPIDVISDKALDITEPLTDPSNLVPVSVSTVAVAWAIWNYHFVLQLIGILGPSVGLVVYLMRKYETPTDLLNDLDKYLQRFAAKPEAKLETLSTTKDVSRQVRAQATPAEIETEPESKTASEVQAEIKPEADTDAGREDAKLEAEQEQGSGSAAPSMESNEPVVADS